MLAQGSTSAEHEFALAGGGPGSEQWIVGNGCVVGCVRVIPSSKQAGDSFISCLLDLDLIPSSAVKIYQARSNEPYVQSVYSFKSLLPSSRLVRMTQCLKVLISTLF